MIISNGVFCFSQCLQSWQPAGTPALFMGGQDWRGWCWQCPLGARVTPRWVPGWRDRHQEGSGKSRTPRECLCCSHSCTPLISPVGLAMVVLQDFPLQVLPWGIRGGNLFTSHLIIHERCELSSYTTQAGLARLPGAPSHSCSSLVAVKGKINSTSCFGDNSFIQITFEMWRVFGVLFAESTQGFSGTGDHLEPGF